MIFREALKQAMKENDLFVFHKLLQDTPLDQKDIFLNFEVLQKALWWTVQRGHAHLMRALLTIPYVAKNAHEENNRALSHAIHSRQANIAHDLLDIPAVHESVSDQVLQEARGIVIPPYNRAMQK